MNTTNLSDIVKVTAAILAKDNKIIIAKRGYGTKGSRIQGSKGPRVQVKNWKIGGRNLRHPIKILWD